MTRYARVTGWGKYLPERVLTNQELESLVNTSDEWITSRTGISERRIAAEHETASSMAIEAGKEALKVAGISPHFLDLIIVATSTADYIFPASASLLQHALDAQKAAAFDVNAACSGFMYAMASACQFVETGHYRNALVVGSEVYSRILDWQDRNTCVLFGDGAGAIVVSSSDSPPGIAPFILGNDGSATSILYTPGPCGVNDGRYLLAMKGPEVFKFAVNIIAQVIKEAAAAAGIEVDQVDVVVPHQANTRILKSAARLLGMPFEKFYINADRYGNTSSASIPIALSEAVEEGRIKDGDNVVLVGVGGGLSWGAVAFTWGPAGRGRP